MEGLILKGTFYLLNHRPIFSDDFFGISLLHPIHGLRHRHGLLVIMVPFVGYSDSGRLLNTGVLRFSVQLLSGLKRLAEVNPKLSGLRTTFGAGLPVGLSNAGDFGYRMSVDADGEPVFFGHDGGRGARLPGPHPSCRLS